VFVRIDGPSFVRRIPALRSSRWISVIGQKLGFVTLVLRSGKVGVIEAGFGYADEDSAAWAEAAMRDATQAFKRRRDTDPKAASADRLGWLADASVDRADRIITVTAPLPPRLLADLAKADTAVLDVESQ